MEKNSPGDRRGGRVVTMATVTSLDRFQTQAIWEMSEQRFKKCQRFSLRASREGEEAVLKSPPLRVRLSMKLGPKATDPFHQEMRS